MRAFGSKASLIEKVLRDAEVEVVARLDFGDVL